MAYHYRVHGLAIECEFELPELASRTVVAGQPPDVRGVAGPVSVSSANATAVPYLKLADRDAIFDLDNAGRFLVRDGTDIVVDMAPEADMALVRLYIFGAVMGMICHQRGLIALHASAVACNGRAVAFTGQPGAGKSTLAAHCLAAGAQLVADDLLVLSFDADRGVLAHPGMPNVKLWRDALAVLGRGAEGLRPDWWRAEKFHLPADDVAEPIPLISLYVLGIDPTAGDGQKERLVGRAAAGALIANTFRGEYLDAAFRRDGHFRDCIGLASKIEVAWLRRAADPARLPETAALIIKQLQGLDRVFEHELDGR